MQATGMTTSGNHPRWTAGLPNAAAWWPSWASPMWARSTLLNALVGQKISITSRKAQTTRHRITGIRIRGPTQFVFVDTPGFKRRIATPRTSSLNKTVLGAVGDVDLVLFVVEAGSVHSADAKVLALLQAAMSRFCWLPNKLDNVHRRGEIGPVAGKKCKSAIRSLSLCPCRPKTPRTLSA